MNESRRREVLVLRDSVSGRMFEPDAGMNVICLDTKSPEEIERLVENGVLNPSLYGLARELSIPELAYMGEGEWFGIADPTSQVVRFRLAQSILHDLGLEVEDWIQVENRTEFSIGGRVGIRILGNRRQVRVQVGIPEQKLQGRIRNVTARRCKAWGIGWEDFPEKADFYWCVKSAIEADSWRLYQSAKTGA